MTDAKRVGQERRPHADVMAGLSGRLSGICDVLPTDRPLVYLDYPVHANIGDLLIHQGAEAFLKRYGYDVRGMFSWHDFARHLPASPPQLHFKRSISDLDRLLADRRTMIALHGGGNIGDLYFAFQRFREMIIERYPENRIVILPQSVHFADPQAQARSAAIFRGHRDLHLFVRDTESLAFSRECGLSERVMPDMAHQLWGDPALLLPRGSGVLVQRRRDKESRDEQAADGRFDWPDLISRRRHFVLRALRKWQTAENPLRQTLPGIRLWRPFRDYLVNSAIARFAPYDTIETDRLHGMILGALMNRNVRFGDGSYGKLDRYARLWLAQSDQIASGDVTSAAG